MEFIIIRIVYFAAVIFAAVFSFSKLSSAKSKTAKLLLYFVLLIVCVMVYVGTFGGSVMLPKIEADNVSAVFNDLCAKTASNDVDYFCEFSLSDYRGNITVHNNLTSKEIERLKDDCSGIFSRKGKKNEIEYIFSKYSTERDMAYLGAVQDGDGEIILTDNQSTVIELHYWYEYGFSAKLFYAIAPIEMFYRPKIHLSDIASLDLRFKETGNSNFILPNEIIVFEN